MSTLNANDRRLLVLALGIFSMAGIVTLIFTIMPRLRMEEPSTRRGKPFFKYVSSPEQLAKSRTRVFRLRSKWEGWARKNASLLKRMRNSRPDDRSILVKVLNTIPYPGKDDFPFAITPEDMGNSEGGDAGVSFFTGEEKLPYDTADPNQSLLHEKAATGQRRIVDDAFVAQRDIPILGTDDSGPTQYILWASGRITEAKVILEPSRKEELAFREIAPSFQFTL